MLLLLLLYRLVAFKADCTATDSAVYGATATDSTR